MLIATGGSGNIDLGGFTNSMASEAYVGAYTTAGGVAYAWSMLKFYAANNALAGSEAELPPGFRRIENGQKWNIPGGDGVYFQMVGMDTQGYGYAVKLVAPEGVTGTLVQHQQQYIGVTKGRLVDRGGYEGWRVQDGTMGIVIQEQRAGMMVDVFVPRTDAFLIGFDHHGTGRAQIDGWAMFIPDKSPADLGMTLGAGKFHGSGNASYFSDTAPSGFSDTGALHRQLRFVRPEGSNTWTGTNF